MQRLQELASRPVTTQWITGQAAEVTPLYVEQGLRAWLVKYFPELAKIKMNWIAEEDIPQFAKNLKMQSFMRRAQEDPEILDRILKEFQRNTAEEDSF